MISIQLEAQSNFLMSNLDHINTYLNSCKNVLNDFSLLIKNDYTYLMLSVLYEIVRREDRINTFLFYNDDESNKEQIDKVKTDILSFVEEEKENITKLFDEMNQRKKDQFLRLKKFEWKVIGLASLEGFEKGEIQPKILVKLTFNDDTTTTFETDYATMKKWVEETEECLSSFNSTWARKIENFAK